MFRSPLSKLTWSRSIAWPLISPASSPSTTANSLELFRHGVAVQMARTLNNGSIPNHSNNSIANSSSSSNNNSSGNLMEFFDEKRNWGAAKVRVGRSWLKDELRLKSNQDLHQLWFVLLKERNMLLTMEAAYEDAVELMPNPERLDKVEESMENLEEVVRERNRAYFRLETGTSGERERVVRTGPFGLDVGYSMREHALPWRMNSSYRKLLRYRFATSHSETVRRFVRRYVERCARQERWLRMQEMRKCANLLKRFPDCDEEALQEKFPTVDVAMVKRWTKVLGHHGNDQFNV